MDGRAARIACGAAVVFLFGLPTSASGQETGACARTGAVEGGAAEIPGGRFTMGSDDAYPEEGPEREVEVESFNLDRHEVTNAEFAAFVEATGYVTVAERLPDPEDFPDIEASRLTPGSAVFTPNGTRSGWWTFVPGASWRAPKGPGSSIEGLEDHPVVHVAYEDAEAYAAWAGRRLPTEAEWERAARGGDEGEPADWGRDVGPEARWRANVWQGVFPVVNTGDDGFMETAPAECYAANPYGLYDMIGNAWEWTSESVRGQDAVGIIKGGSFLCSQDFCARYRPSARQPFERDFSASHIGFRTAGD